MYTTKTLSQWVTELKELKETISWLDEIYKKTDGEHEKQTIFTALKCVEKRYDFIAKTLIEIEVPDIL